MSDVDECVRRIGAGDRQAAVDLVGLVFPLVSRIVAAHVPRGASAEEWLQEVLVRMFDRLDRYSSRAPFEHWLSRLAVRVCIDRLRSHRRVREVRWTDLSDAERGLLDNQLAADAQGISFDGATDGATSVRFRSMQGILRPARPMGPQSAKPMRTFCGRC